MEKDSAQGNPSSKTPLISRRVIRAFDFGVLNFRYIILFTSLSLLAFVTFSPYTISVDGFAYLKSSEVLFTSDFSTFYHWIREPGYPLFIRIFNELGGFFFVFVMQALLVASGISATILGSYKLLNISRVSWRTFLSAGISIALVSGYASALLQQGIFIALFGFLVLLVSRIVRVRDFDLTSITFTLLLVLFATLTAVFIGLAFSLAIFATLIFSGIWRPRVIATAIFVSAVSFTLVMVPWSQVKSSQSPPGSAESLNIGVGAATALVQNFNIANEAQQFTQVLAALLNLGGELPPSSGLIIANENVVFGSPGYSESHSCGRFLHAGPADSLWGPISTDFANRCVPQIGLSLISTANQLVYPLYPIVGLSLLFSMLLSLRIVPSLRPLTSIAFIALLPYLLLDLSISRYGALIIPLGSVLLVEVFVGRSIRMNSRRQTELLNGPAHNSENPFQK